MQANGDTRPFQAAQAHHLCGPVPAQPLLGVEFRQDVVIVGVGRNQCAQGLELPGLVFGAVGEVFQGHAVVCFGGLPQQGAKQIDEPGGRGIAVGMGVNLKTGVPKGSGVIMGGVPGSHPDALVTVQVARGAKLAQAAENRAVQHQLEVISHGDTLAVLSLP